MMLGNLAARERKREREKSAPNEANEIIERLWDV